MSYKTYRIKKELDFHRMTAELGKATYPLAKKTWR